MVIGFLFLGAIAVFLVALLRFVSEKHIAIWFPAYLRGGRARSTQKGTHRKTVDLFLCIADHFEPGYQRPSIAQERQRVDEFVARYPELASRYADWEGRPLQYTFFYPEEEYRREHLDKLAQLCESGFGDVEIHLHHDNDTPGSLREKLVRFKTTLSEQHGLLRRDTVTGDVIYGFIHGNWALDNSLRSGRWCGVNNELQVLHETGCYADFTLPSAPSDAQTRKINSIYYATDDPLRPKSHDGGTDVTKGGKPGGDLMIIQGPLALNWKRRKWGILPRIENGEITADNPPTPDRVDLWVKQGISVIGKPNWVFIKIHTHGAQERNQDVLLGKPMADMLDYLGRTYNDGVGHRLHYVTAYESYLTICAAEAGEDVPKLTRRKHRLPAIKSK